MSSARTAYKLLVENRPVVVVDVETCPGAAGEGDHIIAIAAVTCRQGRQRSTWSTLLDPGVPITNSQYHGLTDADVAGARRFSEVAGELDQILGEPDVILVCHNAAFDVGHLHLEYSRTGTGDQLRDVPVLDTMKLPAVLGYQIPGRSRRLAALCAHFGVTNTQPHNAASDAAATAEVFHALLRIAASGGHIDLGALHTAAGSATARTIELAATAGSPVRSAPVALPAEHLATHTALLDGDPTAAELDRWAADALECARLRCHLLADKARTAVAHAPELHRRLTAALARNVFEPGQGATLVAALNVLAGPGLNTGKNILPVLNWWTKHRHTIRGLPRCRVEVGECPECREGDPCPLDLAHQALVATVLAGPDGRVPVHRRNRFPLEEGRSSTLRRWLKRGFYDLAGYGAWLVIDAWLADRNDVRADRVLDQAVAGGATDPRLTRLHAQRLALHGREREAEAVDNAALACRTTDPGYDELAVWFDRWRARRRNRAAAPHHQPEVPPRNARPAGRVRPRRFALPEEPAAR